MVRSALDEQFEEKEWHFVTESKILFFAKNVQNKIQEAKKKSSAIWLII